MVYIKPQNVAITIKISGFQINSPDYRRTLHPCVSVYVSTSVFFWRVTTECFQSNCCYRGLTDRQCSTCWLLLRCTLIHDLVKSCGFSTLLCLSWLISQPSPLFSRKPENSINCQYRFNTRIRHAALRIVFQNATEKSHFQEQIMDGKNFKISILEKICMLDCK